MYTTPSSKGKRNACCGKGRFIRNTARSNAFPYGPSAVLVIEHSRQAFALREDIELLVVASLSKEPDTIIVGRYIDLVGLCVTFTFNEDVTIGEYHEWHERVVGEFVLTAGAKVYITRVEKLAQVCRQSASPRSQRRN